MVLLQLRGRGRIERKLSFEPVNIDVYLRVDLGVGENVAARDAVLVRTLAVAVPVSVRVSKKSGDAFGIAHLSSATALGSFPPCGRAGHS